MIILIKLKAFLKKIKNDFANYQKTLLDLLLISIDKASNLSKTNFNLGLYHIYHGNITDAKLRLTIVKYLFSNFANTNYHLARCYIYQKNNKKALNYLALDEPLAIYRRQIIEKKEILFIPIDVIIEDFDFYANFNTLHSSSVSFIEDALSNIIKLKEVSNFSKILDLGCGKGNFGVAIEKTFTHSFVIDALDISSHMIDICKTLKNKNNDPIYNNFYISNYRNFNTTQNEKYDLIISNFSLQYSQNLREELAYIVPFLNHGGIIMLSLYTSTTEYSFDYELQNFCYSENYIKESIEKNNLNIIEMHSLTTNENRNIIYFFLKTN